MPAFLRACLPACLGGLVRARVRGRAGGSVCVCNVSMSVVSLFVTENLVF